MNILVNGSAGSCGHWLVDGHPDGYSGPSPIVPLQCKCSVEQQSAFAHADEPVGINAFFRLRINADAIVVDGHSQIILAHLNANINLSRVRVAHDVRESFLENTEQGNGLERIKTEIFHV